MRKKIKLLLTLTVLVIVTGTLGAPAALAGAPSSGTPTPLSDYGTIVLATTFTPSGGQLQVNLYIFSTSGPFYVEKVNMEALSSSSTKAIELDYVYYDYQALSFFAHCAVVIPSFNGGNLAGNIISATPSLMLDPSGALSIPAAGAVQFYLTYSCFANKFPSTLQLSFEATVLAPTAATVSICANDGTTALTSCTAS